MAKYYATVSGLPNIGVEDRKLPFSSDFFVEELEKELSKTDKRLLDILRYEEDNPFLIRFLENEQEARDAEDQPKLFTYDDVKAVLEALRERKKLPKAHSVPTYAVDFLRDTQVELTEEEQEQKEDAQERLDEEERRTSFPVRLEDKLSESYFSYALQCGNDFIEQWSRFNMTLRNIFAAHVGRQLGWSPADYVVGDSPLERKLKTSTAKNFGLDDDDLEGTLSRINSILEETDITRRERMIDLLKWEWLEDKTFDKVFDIEAILCYYLRLRILERWTSLNEETGEATFRSIVAALKKESNESLEEFKKNQKK